MIDSLSELVESLVTIDFALNGEKLEIKVNPPEKRATTSKIFDKKVLQPSILNNQGQLSDRRNAQSQVKINNPNFIRLSGSKK